MLNPIGIECAQLIKASYQASMYNVDGFPHQPARRTITVCRKLGYYPLPADCRICRKCAIRENYIKEMTIDEN